MRAEDLTEDNMCREVTVLGLRFLWWRRVVWSDGFFQPAWFEFRLPNGHGFVKRMGRYHPWGPTTEIPNGVK
jgi:hypothetical protein